MSNEYDLTDDTAPASDGFNHDNDVEDPSWQNEGFDQISVRTCFTRALYKDAAEYLHERASRIVYDNANDEGVIDTAGLGFDMAHFVETEGNVASVELEFHPGGEIEVFDGE